ncbi:MAG TPA: 2-phospho-L-lactate transferase [Terriglobia bacterium]|nr:2-phospho-L-lactate transferase [Terriglobia bacterium]
MITVLTGGTGGAKLIQGLAQIAPPEEITAVVNTGDDLAWWGLRVSPDLDSITYALAGMLSADRGWGVEGDTFQCLDAMRRLGAPAWFQLGDRDLSTHLVRSELLAAGKTLSEATEEITSRLGIASRVLPMTDSRVETRVLTAQGELSFQEYFVRERFAPAVQAVRFAGAAESRPAPGVVEAIEKAEVVLLAPSNPITSVGPILAVPGIREALKRTPAPVGAVSPIVGGAAVSGPAGHLMQAQGLPVSAEGVACAYADFLDVLFADPRDAAQAGAVQSLGVRLHPTCVIMKSSGDRTSLARIALEIARRL